MLDGVERRQFRAGEEHGISKLTELQVKEILAYVDAGDTTKTDIAKKFNVSRTTVRLIASGDRWKYVPRT